jgi:adenylate cyclase
MSFLAELRRRNVIRMAGLYLVGAWLIVQVAGTILPMFDAPDWVARTIVVLLAIGFIPALVISWVFELTPDGLRREDEIAPADPTDSNTPNTAQRMNRMIMVVMALALGYFAFDKFLLAPGRESAHAQAVLASTQPNASASDAADPTKAVQANSIAVMPFVNMSSDKDQEYFSDGMTEEILNALANVPNLAVTARTSVFSLKGQNKDVREIGKLLGVAYVLEGSVRKAGDELRITAQLVRADSGFHLWSESYDRKLEKVFDLQAELAGAIAKALELPLGLGGDAALVRERSADPEAYALYLQARAAYRARGDGVKKSIELYRAALKRDPEFAPAWAGLASSLAVLPWYIPGAERVNTPDFMREAEQAGKQALAQSPNLPQGHIALGMVYTFQWRWALAGQSFKRAMELAPNDVELNYQYADWLSAVGRSEEALAAANKAVALDPLVPIFLNGQANMLSRLGREDEAIDVRQAAYALAPELRTTTENLFYSYLVAGRLDEAEAMVDEIRSSASAEANRDPTWGATEAVQRVARALTRVLRDPAQREAVREALDDQEYAGLLSWLSKLGSTPEDIDQQFKQFEAQLDTHLNGVDPIGFLRSARYADYRKDPRYIRLLNIAGFDDEGKIR